MAEAIRTVLDTPALAAELKAKGEAKLRRFSWQACAREVDATYRR